MELALSVAASSAESLAMEQQAYAWALEELPESWRGEPLEDMPREAWESGAGLGLGLELEARRPGRSAD